MIVETRSEHETAAVGCRLGEALKDGSHVILLTGDLGAGKTAFVRGLAEGVSLDPSDVSSPTFTLIQVYRGGRLPLYHVDLYRLKPSEVDDIGVYDLTIDAGVVAIEWPDRLPLPFDAAIRVAIRHGDGDARTIEIENGPEGI